MTDCLNTAVSAYIDNTAKSTGDGAYHATAKTVLQQWLNWCNTHDITSLTELSPSEIRTYVQHLNKRMRDSEITASTVHTYFNIVRGCLSWCVTDSRLDANPADSHPALSALPTDTQDPDTSQQFWNPTQIQELLSHVNHEARTAIDNNPKDALAPVRDRSLAHTLTFSGARGAELFSSPTDTRKGRNGITWNRVDLEAGTIEVLGKSQNWEHAQLPNQATHALTQLYRTQNPSSDDWPVFTTLHAPTLYNTARENLADRGHTEYEVEERITNADTPTSLLRDLGIAPPSITTEGARTIMKRLCNTADIDINGEYLKPHGGRRGLGHILYQEQAELAQSALRHESIETTHQAYSDIVASDTSDTVSDVLETSLNSPSSTDE
jgi:site-specific recombinase XerC